MNTSQHINSQTILKYLALFIGLIIVVLMTIKRTAVWGGMERTDFTVYVAAAKAILQGADIYDAHSIRGWYYVYPPLFAILSIPFGLIPVWLGALIWCLLSLAIFFFTYRIIVKDWSPGNSFVRYMPIWVLFIILLGATMRGQASILVCCLCVLSVLATLRNQSFYAGFSLALAASIKVYPITLLVFFVMYKQWRVVATCILSLLFLDGLIPLLYLGLNDTLHAYQRWIEVIGHPIVVDNTFRQHSPLFHQLLDTAKGRNQSLEALGLTFGMSAQFAKYFSVLAGLVLLAIIYWHRNSQSRIRIGAAMLIWMTLISPIAEGHYFMVLILPMVLLLKDTWPGHFDRRFSILSVILFLSVLVTQHKLIEQWRPITWLSIVLLFWMLNAQVPHINKKGLAHHA